MPTTNKTTTKSASRPRFSAPKAPSTSDQVVQNAPQEPPVEDAKLVVETVSDDQNILTNNSTSEEVSAETAPLPKTLGRTITRDKLDIDESPLMDVLTESQTQEAPDISSKTKDSDSQAPPSDQAHPPSSGKSLLLVGLIILLTVFASIGWGLYLNAIEPGMLANLGQSVPTPTPEPTPTTAPTPTPAPAIVLEILNGSGVPGAAAEAQTILEKLDFKVDSIGNADSSNYKTTKVTISPNFTRTETLITTLKEVYQAATVSGNLDSDAKVDAQIILGQDWSLK